MADITCSVRYIPEIVNRHKSPRMTGNLQCILYVIENSIFSIFYLPVYVLALDVGAMCCNEAGCLVGLFVVGSLKY